MDFSEIKDIDIKGLINNFTTENIIEFLKHNDPATFVKNPYYLITFIIICALLFFFKFRKTLVFFIGIIIIWYAFVNYMPKTETIQLNDIFTFSVTCILVLIIWIYYFFIKAD